MHERFIGVEGTAYIVGGFGVNFQQYDGMKLAPIRTGIGMRMGLNAGYLKYSRRADLESFLIDDNDLMSPGQVVRQGDSPLAGAHRCGHSRLLAKPGVRIFSVRLGLRRQLFWAGGIPAFALLAPSLWRLF